MVSSCQEQMTTQGPVNPGLLGSTHHVSLMNRHGTEHKLFHPLFHFSPSSFPPLSFPCICIFPKANQSLLWSDLNFSPDTAHSKLILCENKKRASSRENVPQNDATPPTHTHQGQEEFETIFIALGRTCFTSGRHYWEAEVNVKTEGGPGTGWVLGVCSDTVQREGWFVECPEKNFWVVAYEEGEISALTSPLESQSLRRVPPQDRRFPGQGRWGLGLRVCPFTTDGSHIYFFTRITFCMILCPILAFRVLAHLWPSA